MIEVICTPLNLLMKLCYEILNNYIAAIVVFTFLTKVVLLPVNLWVHRSGIKMVEMMPELNRLKIKHFGDKDTIADETQALYKRMNYHPLASTLPMIIQIVLLMGVIEAVKALLGGSEHMLNQIPIEVGGAALLMPLCAGLAALALTLSQNIWNPLQKEQSKAEQISTGAVSVGISLFLGAFVSLGTGVYWIASNLWSIPFQLLMNAIIDPKKYVDYEALEESRKELESMAALGTEISKEDKQREKADYKRFFSIANKHLVFYSEKSGFYKYYEDLIGELLRRTNVVIHYVTSDPNDQIFRLAEQEKRIRAYYIGEKRLITLFMKMDADIVVMTTPDLDTFHLKRSYVRKDIEYIFVNHGLGSINTEYRNGALDHFDTVYLNNEQDKREIRAWEKVKQLPEKRLVEYGYPMMDHLLDDYDAMMNSREEMKNTQPKIVIAPSWQPDNIMDSCIDQMLNGLMGKGYKIVVRPHPQYVRHHANDLQKIQAKYQPYEQEISFDTTFASFEDIYCSDLLITDWSGVGFEFSFTTCRPTLFIHTPMKILNPEYELIQVESFQERMRSRIGQDLPLEQVGKIGETVAVLLENAPQYAEAIDHIRREERYNFRGAAKVGASDILNRLKERKKK